MTWRLASWVLCVAESDGYGGGGGGGAEEEAELGNKDGDCRLRATELACLGGGLATLAAEGCWAIEMMPLRCLGQ